MNLTINEKWKNYTCQVIKLPNKTEVKGLDNLVSVIYQGNSCLISRDSNEDELYLFFPAECKISTIFLEANNLYRHSELNVDKEKKGFFEDSGRVKALKFKGVISSGFIVPIRSLDGIITDWENLQVGQEFNSIGDIEICRKYSPYRTPGEPGSRVQRERMIDQLVNSKFAPEHPDTAQLLRNVHKLELSDTVAITYKLHGTSARYYNTVVNRKLNWFEKLLTRFGIKIQTEEYDYVSASRRVVKSLGFEELPDKQHYYSSGDLWSEVGKNYFNGKLNKGEAVYCEIIGSSYSGEAIQHSYTYGFKEPKVYIYRISNINPQGIEIDLPYEQMKQRAEQLGIPTCPELWYNSLELFIETYLATDATSRNIEEDLNEIFYNRLLEQPSIIDSSIVEEGFCIRIDKYPKPEIFKIKSKKFLLHESGALDKEVIDIEDGESN